MAQIEGEVTIDRTVEEVFDFVADERNEPRFNPQMTSVDKLSVGPIGLGTQFGAEVMSGGRPVSMVIEFTDFDRPHRLGSRTTMSGMVILGVLTFESVGEGRTRMRWAWEMRPGGAMRLLKPLIVLIGRRQERAIWNSLKECLEGETTGKSPAARAPHRIGAAVACLRISAALYVLVGLLFLPLMTAGFDDLSPFALFSALGMFAFCVLLAVLIGRLIAGLWDRKLWAWAAALAVFGIYLPSGYFLLGAIGIWALLQEGTRAEFGQS